MSGLFFEHTTKLRLVHIGSLFELYQHVVTKLHIRMFKQENHRYPLFVTDQLIPSPLSSPSEIPLSSVSKTSAVILVCIFYLDSSLFNDISAFNLIPFISYPLCYRINFLKCLESFYLTLHSPGTYLLALELCYSHLFCSLFPTQPSATQNNLQDPMFHMLPCCCNFAHAVPPL